MPSFGGLCTSHERLASCNVLCLAHDASSQHRHDWLDMPALTIKVAAAKEGLYMKLTQEMGLKAFPGVMRGARPLASQLRRKVWRTTRPPWVGGSLWIVVGVMGCRCSGEPAGVMRLPLALPACLPHSSHSCLPAVPCLPACPPLAFQRQVARWPGQFSGAHAQPRSALPCLISQDS
jgi:hypothetical protein